MQEVPAWLPEVAMLMKTLCEHHNFKLTPQEQHRMD